MQMFYWIEENLCISLVMKQLVDVKKNRTTSYSDKDASNAGRRVTITDKSHVSKIREIIESDDRFVTICDIAKAFGISLSPVHFILKPIKDEYRI